MTPIKALLFDFDGVLADTEALHLKAWREVLAPYDLELDWATYERECVGVSDIAMCNVFCKLCRKPITPDEIRALYPRKRKIFQELTGASVIVDPQLVEMLRQFGDLKLAVVTSSNRAEVEPLLQRSGVLSILTGVVYGGDVKHHKPHPEPYVAALRLVGAMPDEAVVFEDSDAGTQSGKAAGCRVVRVKTPSEVAGLVQAVVSGVLDF